MNRTVYTIVRGDGAPIYTFDATAAATASRNGARVTASTYGGQA